ncbi:hypothetical protein [Paractinoplanes hotanensis]|uniref:Uncharacterized protein n=1 Tax=Paractinoplanes hotanensis TaxID=2906497 RepID=A0ABT0Y340_9ACTN|nr:hypothetical protein [Actinoplanes hotanensis]MCM4080412.1 hypothetical protein [Actinoplanes hotanensis]
MEATTEAVQELGIDDVWHIGVTSDAVASILVTDPEGTTAVATLETDSEYEWSLVVDAAGRWLASVTSTEGAIHFVANVTAVNALPGLADLRGADPAREDPDDLGYLGENSWTDTEIQDALDAETTAQRGVCRVPATYPDDLREALMRRVAVNLARRKLPLMVLRGDSEQGNTVPPSRDSEVRRLEGPHRRLKVG